MTKTFKLNPVHILALITVAPMTPAVADLEVTVDRMVTAETESTSTPHLEGHSLMNHSLIVTSLDSDLTNLSSADNDANKTALATDYLTNEQVDNQYNSTKPLDNTVEPPTEKLENTDDDWQWVDEEHKEFANRLDKWANKMNGWFGEPDLDKPATANLRVILDTRWIDDPIAGSDITVEPRVRGRLKLPVLERRLSLIFGDDDLDEDTVLKQDLLQKVYRAENSNQDKVVDEKQIRDDNASIALRWSRFGEKLGVETDVDVGIHSFDDLYVKVSIDKEFYRGEKLVIRNDNFYRYGVDSEHYAKAALNLGYQIDSNKLINNRAIIRYRNKGDQENTTWSNELQHVHDLGNHKQLSYGLSAFGFFESDNPSLNSYGPNISYRQPIWREWLFVQTDFNYYNNKLDNKNHHASALLRFEALF